MSSYGYIITADGPIKFSLVIETYYTYPASDRIHLHGEGYGLFPKNEAHILPLVEEGWSVDIHPPGIAFLHCQVRVEDFDDSLLRIHFSSEEVNTRYSPQVIIPKSSPRKLKLSPLGIPIRRLRLGDQSPPA